MRISMKLTWLVWNWAWQFSNSDNLNTEKNNNCKKQTLANLSSRKGMIFTYFSLSALDHCLKVNIMNILDQIHFFLHNYFTIIIYIFLSIDIHCGPF